MIHFGTDGWRAVIADTFTFENVRLVAQAVANWVNRQGEASPTMVVGYDTRFLSDRFAAETARVLAANGITVWLTRTDAPTPAISFNVKEKQAIAGVVITASHNPPRYNGFKVKSRHGSSASPEDCQAIEEELALIQQNGGVVNTMDYDEAIAQEKIIRFDPSWLYYQHLTSLVDLDQISAGELSVVADAMWGSGRGAFSSMLARTRSHVISIRDVLNPGFGGIHPEPMLKYLNELVATVQRIQADVGLATDGDADRIGAIDGLGNYIDPHHIFSLVLRHLIENKGLRGDVVKTVSTTLMIDSIAATHGLTVHETPVGFNHIADLMMNHDVLMGGEESGGMSIRGHIPEGDGILMGLMLLEVIAHAGVPLHEVVVDLQAKHGPAYYARIDSYLARKIPKQDMVQMMVDSAPNTMNGEVVKRVDTLDGVKFYLADHSWLLIRPSGTEPVLRIYAEAHTPDAVKNLLEIGSTMGISLTERA
ncbi:MAG: phosphoglucomutase/phosphomannomutase family protein [Chloroflexi bacterium]|nr:MAG: phosphoglucomutase/phosphomannomutase family protein [Chloroflexota bacterium]